MLFNKIKKALFLSPHPDDVELGCGGLIHKLINIKVHVSIAVFSNCQISLPKKSSPNTLINEFHSSFDTVKLPKKNRIIYDYPTRRLNEARQDILEDLVKLNKKLKPDLVVIPSSGDIHQDHQTICAEATRAFFKKSTIWGYELPWNQSTFKPTCFVRLSKQDLKAKIRMLNSYTSQLKLRRPYFSARNLESLATTRGMQCGSKGFAEAFEVVKQIY
mgnify:FL=1|tara:strand:+ start:708 stop:1358 length:651 start_codon:yes stop_codon:yes gene_type:complete